jgi:predicted ATPase/DNA-binding SARP family transcriptional activator
LQLPDGTRVKLPTRKTRALLAYLGVQVGRPFARSTLMGLLWGEVPEANAQASLRQALVDLRKALPRTPPGLLIEERNVTLKASVIAVDVSEFEQLFAEATPAALETAVTIYQGELLEGLSLNAPAFEEWLLGERERLRGLATKAMETLLAYQVESGRLDTALRTAGRLLALDPLRESAHRTLMSLYARQGRWTDVARQYQICLTRLRQELAVEPESETKLLYDHLLEQRAMHGGVGSFGSRIQEHTHPNNLPRQLTSFIGREHEMDEIKRLLRTTRLLTITGTGGSGKTRLALQISADLITLYPNGIWLVELAALSDPTLVPKAVATAIDLPEQPGRNLTEILADALQRKSILIILDNCEHLVAACADLTTALLRTCPNLRVLATSREALGVMGEITWRVPSLSVPDPQHLPPLDRFTEYEAVRLFIDRAAATTPKFAVTRSNAPAVAQVCHRLDGIPLAIELAAARVKVLEAEQIAARLDDRFGLLTGGSRTVLPRQQTLRAAMDWSYNLLSESERVLLQRLAVFAGGWTLEAAEAVCSRNSVEASAILDSLTQLVDKSLVAVETFGGGMRYRLLETVRQYAHEKLRETDDITIVSRRHRDYLLNLTEEGESKFWGPAERHWLDRLEAEHDNLRAVIAWSVEHEDDEAALRLVGALGWFWYRYGHWAEGRNWAESTLKRAPDAPPVVRLRGLRTAGDLAVAQGDTKEGILLYTEALRLARQLRDKREMGRSLHRLGHAMVIKGEWQQADAALKESVAVCRQSEDTWTTAAALRRWSTVALRRKDYAQARDRAAKGVALFRRIGYVRGISMAMRSLSYVAYHEQNYAEAGALLQESIALREQINDEESSSLGLVELGNLARRLGDHDRAVEYLTEALITQQKLGAKILIPETLESLAAVSASRGLMLRAARLFGAAAALRKTSGQGGVFAPPDHSELLEAVRAALPEPAFTGAWEFGGDMTLERAIEYALAGQAIDVLSRH